MTGELAQELATRRARAAEVDDDDGLFHAAHASCQLDRTVVTLMCGKKAPWDDARADNPGQPDCPLCWNARRCPVCGGEVAEP